MVQRTKSGLAVFAAIAALLLCLSFANVGVAAENLEGMPETLKGTVIAVDTSLPMNIVTLQSSGPGPTGSSNQITFFVDDETLVKVCNAKTTLDDVRPGSEVQVSYFEVAGLAFANSIYKAC